jgi:hypothetical protein
MGEKKDKQEKTNTVLEVQSMTHAVGVQIKPAARAAKEKPNGK